MLSLEFKGERTKQKVIMLFAALAGIYTLLTLLLPPDDLALRKYNLTATELKAVGLTVVIPYILVWVIAVIGYLRLKTYAHKIRKSKDGKAMSTIADGLLILALWMPLSTIATRIGTAISRSNPDLLPATIITTNYLTLILVFGAFYLIAQGASQLPSVLKAHKVSLPDKYSWLVAFIGLSGFYGYMTLNNPAREHVIEGVSHATYYLPDWLLLSTIVIPYILVWYLGLRAAMHISMYTAKIPGVLYKAALTYISRGLVFVIISLIVLRVLSSLTAWFNDQSLKTVLLIVYILLIIIAAGYVSIAQGAKKLQEIEES